MPLFVMLACPSSNVCHPYGRPAGPDALARTRSIIVLCCARPDIHADIVATALKIILYISIEIATKKSARGLSRYVKLIDSTMIQGAPALIYIT